MDINEVICLLNNRLNTQFRLAMEAQGFRVEDNGHLRALALADGFSQMADAVENDIPFLAEACREKAAMLYAEGRVISGLTTH